MEKLIWKKGLAAVTTVCLAAGSFAGLSGCGQAEGNEKDSQTTDSQIEGQEAETKGAETKASETEDSGKAMGRYLEEDMSLPENCQTLNALQALEDGTLRIVYTGEENSIFIADSKDGGASWQTGESLNDKLEINTEDGSSIFIPACAVSDKGDVFISFYIQKDTDSESSPQFYCISADGQVHNLDLSGISDNLYVFSGAFTGNGTLLLRMPAKGIIEVDSENGSKVHVYEDGNSVDYFGTAGNTLSIIVNGAIHYYDLETKEPITGREPLTEQISSKPENLILQSTASVPVVFCPGDEKDTLFFADHNGLYRYASGGNVVEQVADGTLNSMGSPDTAFVSLSRDKDGVFYLTVRGDSGGLNVLKYVYSKDTPSVPDTELKLYSLRDNPIMKQAATAFQKKYPNIYLSIETGMSGDDAVTNTDAIKTLNTEIMAGKGPDIMILDGIPENTYVEKGMLEDLSGVLKEAGILDNVKEAYTQEDGSIYCMPTRFGIPLIVGKEDDVDRVTDLSTMGDVLEAHQEEYSWDKQPLTFIYSTDFLLGVMSEVNYPAWLDEKGTLDEGAVKEFLEQVNRIYETGKSSTAELMEKYGMTQEQIDSMTYSREYGGVSAYAMDMKYDKAVLGVGLLLSPNGFADIYSAEKDGDSLIHGLWDGQAKNCFAPLQVVGISAKTAEKEAAEKFIQFLFSEEAQRLPSYSSGFPVKEKVFDDLDYWNVVKSEGGVMASAGNNITGDEMELISWQPTEDVIQGLQELGKSLTQPVEANEIILNAVTNAGVRYLQGEISLEEAARDVTQQVNLYLSE